MKFLDVLDNLNPEIHEHLKLSLELGKWPDGEPLTTHQQEVVMQSLISWGRIHLPEQERIGYIDKGAKEHSNESISGPSQIPLIGLRNESE